MRPDEILSLIRTNHIIEQRVWWADPLFLEFAFWSMVALITFALTRFHFSVIKKIEDFGAALGRKKSTAVAIVFVAALATRAALLPIIPVPEPYIHDEYSYLLQAKTFASGRVTNPSPAMGVHFETFHVNMWPSYQSMYPPAQALPMAAALVLHLAPWWGVWLSAGLMCAAVCWMLQGWMPPQWAFLGGLFCVLRLATYSYWTNSYLNPSVSVIGGALVLGALPRLRRTPTVSHALVLALGLGILANSRPYEGFVFSIPTVLLLLYWHGIKQGKRVRAAIFAPALLLLGLIAAGTGYYNWRNTGNPVLMPYVVNQHQYHISRPFIWQKAYPIPHYRHQIMRTMYVRIELPDYLLRQYSFGLRKILTRKLLVIDQFFLWPFLVLMFVSIWKMLKSRRVWPIAFTVLFLFAGLMIEEWPLNSHYAAPMECAVIAIMLYGLRLLRQWRPRKTLIGPQILQAVMIMFCLWSAVEIGATALDPYHLTFFSGHATIFERSRLTTELDKIPGQHLVLVHTQLSNLGFDDWVYNEPDIDRAKIIWARDMGDAGNAELLRYYPNRRVWIVNQDDGVMQLTPYPNQDPQLETFRSLAFHATAEPLSALHR